MGKIIVEIDKNYNNAIEQLSNYGKVEKISIILNLFTVETTVENIEKIRKIEGVIYIEQDREGYLLKSVV